jgi:oxygen-independent coproporphyrinogen-3 oxidase
MAGIYLHIPFCMTRCVYCDFFSSTDSREKDRYVEALCQELLNRQDYLEGQTIGTIYFGGGTPSQLTAQDFDTLFSSLRQFAHLTASQWSSLEITLEANPDDLTPAYLQSIQHLPFNRISIGVQSFNDSELTFLRRRHDAQKAIDAVKLCQCHDFQNISIDLMYGLPGQTLSSWQQTIQQALDLRVQHISAYHLIYEEGTALHKLVQSGAIQPVDEELSLQMFETLIDTLAAAGYEQYEISNFCQPGYHSRHNSSYWQGSYYIGIGAAAHSYNGTSRQWNTPSIRGGYSVEEIELLDDRATYNDFILTRLRTAQGIDLAELKATFGEAKALYCLEAAKKHLTTNLLCREGNTLRLTRSGLFVSDGIMADLIY